MINIGRSLGVLPMIFFGVWNIPFSPAKPVDYTNVIGSPLILPKIENPSIEEIQKYHQIFIREMTKLYEENKAFHGMENVTLRIA